MRKFLLITMFAIILNSSQMMTVFAQVQDNYQSNLTNKEVENLANELNITEDELINLDEYIKLALEKLPRQLNDAQTVKVSDNLILELTMTSEQDIHRAYEITVTGTLKLKNLLGITIVTLNSIGVFEVNNNKVTTLDAYGTYSGFVWSLDYIDSYKSGAGSTANARSSFKGELNIGTDGINKSFNAAGTVYQSANGEYWTSWS